MGNIQDLNAETPDLKADTQDLKADGVLDECVSEKNWISLKKWNFVRLILNCDL